MTSTQDAELVAFLQWVLPSLGLRWPGYRKVRKQVGKRIRRRIDELALSSFGAYRDYVEAHPDELATVAHACRVTISRFYRDHVMFDRLFGDILPDLAEAAIAHGDPALRVWSAGCACGEEAYTIAIGWQLALATRFPDLPLEIVATDIDEDVLERARRGCYPAGSLRECPVAWKREAFRWDGDLARVHDTFHDCVSFVLQDLRESAPEGRFHLVLCRNLAFTYFDTQLQREAAARIRTHMSDGGVLMVGCNEVLPAGTPELSPGPARGFYVAG